MYTYKYHFLGGKRVGFTQCVHKIVSFLLVFCLLSTYIQPALAQSADSQEAPSEAESAEVPLVPADAVPVESASTSAPEATDTTAQEPSEPVESVVPASDTPSVAESLPEVPVQTPVPTYADLMRQIASAKDGTSEAKQAALASLEAFITAEHSRLAGSEINKTAYFSFLELQKQVLGQAAPEHSFLESVISAVKEVVGLEDQSFKTLQPSEEEQVKIPESPATFSFNNNNPTIDSVDGLIHTSQPAPSVWDSLWGDPVSAATSSPQLPTIEDLGADTDVVISPTIRGLATTLHNNPVEILNYLRQTIFYEPYFGSKKGSEGCLVEKYCNDVDAASLTIALMRAAGIPAHYKKSIVVMPAATVQNLLGVDELRTAYAALAFAGVPVGTLSPDNIGKTIDQADFSKEKSLGVVWVRPEIFFTYDERGGNLPNDIPVVGVTTTIDLQNLVVRKNTREWVAIDPLVKKYARTVKPVVADLAGFDSASFWTNYLSYQGALSPFAKYVNDLQNQTGKNATSSQYQSVKTIVAGNLAILPASLPYSSALGELNGNNIAADVWSTLPASQKQSVTITLKRADNNAVVLTKTFWGPQINNVAYTLLYQGATPQDQTEIDANGGIAYAPAALVDIVPVLAGFGDTETGQTKIKIGDSLVLQFDHLVGGNVLYTDEKFSTAGNTEGIFVALSRVQNDVSIQSTGELLLRGPGEIARQYLLREQTVGDSLKASLDYEYQASFQRAVVTQNRVLNNVNGVATTFDFNGLTLDAAVVINDYSNAGHYKTHLLDFRRLWGLDASYYEAQLFSDLAALEGISTVKGLQYAHAHPLDYTVSAVASTTPNYQNLINSWLLPTSTRQALIAAVDANKTIVSPNKPIVSGQFKGVVYIALAPNATGQYAIGQQVQNGGWTVNQYTLTNWKNDQNKSQYAYEFVNGPDQFIYKDNPANTITCSIKVATYNAIVGGNMAPGWDKAKYGRPCMNDNENGPYLFGVHDHSLIVATDGAYFKSVSDNYAYWEKNNILLSKFYAAEPNDPLNSVAQLYPYWGTYVYNGSTRSKKKLAMYNPAKKDVYELGNAASIRYTSSDQLLGKYMPNLLGYPKMNIAAAATYQPKKSTGKYQQFTNGTLYINDLDPPHIYGTVVVGPLDQEMSEQGGTSVVGFPLADPKQSNGYVYQYLQSDNDLSWKLADGSHAMIPHIAYNCTFNGDYADHWYSSLLMPVVMLHGIFDSGISLVDSLSTVAKEALEFAMYNPDLIIDPTHLNKVQYLFDNVNQVNFKLVVEYFRRAPTIASAALINEYDLSFGKKGCSARQWYIEGRLGGEFLQIFLPAKQLAVGEKLKALAMAERAGVIEATTKMGGWLKYRAAAEEAARALVKPGTFELEEIQQTLLGKFSSIGTFQGQGLHSAATLKAGMESGALEVWDSARTIKYSKFSDIPVTANGVRDVRIMKDSALSLSKTIFPEKWTDEDIVNAIVEASSHNYDPIKRTFFSDVTIKGITLRVTGHLDREGGKILDGYVDYLFK